MADTEQHETPAGAPVPGRGVRPMDGKVLIDGVIAFMRGALSEVFSASVADAAVDKALKLPQVKAMLSRCKVKAKATGPATMRSSYTMFVQDFLSHIKAAGISASLPEASSIWRTLPEDVKEELNKRYQAVKETYNAKVEQGVAVNLADEMAAYAEEEDLEPVDYVQLYNNHKAATAAAPPATANGAAQPKAGAKAAAAPAAAAAGAGGKRAAAPAAEEEQQQQQHSHKKHKKDKEKTKEKKKEKDPEKKEKKVKEHKKKHKAADS